MSDDRLLSLKLSEVQKLLRAEIIYGDHKLETEVETAAGSDLMSDLLTGPTAGALLLSGLNNLQVIRTAVIAGFTGVVLVRDKKPDPEMIAQARMHDMPLMTTPFTLFTACGRLFKEGIRGVERKKKSQ
jgi:hypothetical protein